MARRTIITVIVLVVILALLYWIQQSRKDEDAGEYAQLSVSVFNQTKNQDGTAAAASPRDILIYTLTVQNTSDDTISGYVVETSIDDVSELADLTDAAGANYNAATSALMWTPQDIPGNGSIEKQFTVRVKDSIPSDSDKVMTLSFGGEVSVAVANNVAGNQTPVQNPGQSVTPSYQAPTTGPSVWFAFLLALTFTAGIILYRAAKSIKV
jgi:uncharacterized repeat protein (TIGR01451 family)